MSRCTSPTAFLLICLALFGCQDYSPSEVDHSANLAQHNKTTPPHADTIAVLGIGEVNTGDADNPIQVTVPSKQKSDHNVLINLTGSISTNNGSPILRQTWFQTGGPQAAMLTPNQSETMVLIPYVTQPTLLRFRLAAVNQEWMVNSAETTVLVTPTTNHSVDIIPMGFNQDQSAMEYRVRLAEPSQQDITLNYSTQDVLGASDFYAAGSVFFSEGQQEETIFITAGDTQIESNAIIRLTLEGLVGNRDVRVTQLSSPGAQSNELNVVSLPPSPVNNDNIRQDNLEGQSGTVRVQLKWDSDSSIQLEITDPCNNSLRIETPIFSCNGYTGRLEIPPETTNTINIYWQGGAPNGDYVVRVLHEQGTPTNYKLYTFFAESIQQYSGLVMDGETVSLPPFSFENPVQDYIPLSGQVVNALSGEGIPNANVTIGLSSPDGPFFTSVEMGSNGHFTADLSQAPYWEVHVTAPGYASYFAEIPGGIDQEPSTVIALSPTLTTEFGRVILSWNAEPRDLDTHFIGDDGTTLSYRNKSLMNTDESQFATLDRDSTGGFGPETLTIYNTPNQTFTYAVHRYTGSGTLAESGVTVALILNNGYEVTLNTPPQTGDWWYVFEIDGETGITWILDPITGERSAPLHDGPDT